MAIAWRSTLAPSLRVEKVATRASLTRDSLWSLAAQLATAAGQWGPLMLLARMGEPALVGRYALALALVSPPLLLANLQLRPVILADVEGRFSLAACSKLRLRSTLVAAVVVTGLIGTARLHPVSALETGLVAGIKILEQWADLYDAVLQKNGRLAACASAAALKAFLSLVLFAIALQAGGRLWLALVAAASAHALVLACIERPMAARLAGDCAPSEWLDLARRTLPLGFVVLMISLISNFPRWFIERRQGLESLGHFAALGCFATAFQILVGAIAQAAAPRLAADFRFHPQAFVRLTVRLSLLVAAAGFVAVALCRWSGPLLARLYQPSYAAHQDLLAWLMAAGAIGALTAVLGTALTAAGILGPQAILYGFAAGVSATCCFFWIDATRPASAVLPLVASALVIAVGQARLLQIALARNV